jgi:hypothetical protein
MAELKNYLKLNGTWNIGDNDLSDQLEINLKYWLDWTLLRIGAWYNAEIPASGAFGGEQSTLRKVNNGAYAEGKLWEGFRKDWVYETGVQWTGDETPIEISGVWVDGVYYEPDDADYGHYVDYPNGRVVFTGSDIPETVEANYSYRHVQVYRADEAEWWRELQYKSFRVDNPHFNQLDEGSWNTDPEQRIQLPAIVIEAVPRASTRPYELGNSTLTIEKDVLFHVIAEDRRHRNGLCDKLLYQTDKCIYLFDSNSVAQNEDYPINGLGQLVGDKMYPDLVDEVANDGYRWKKCRFTKGVSADAQTLNPYLHIGTVRLTCEVEIGNV